VFSTQAAITNTTVWGTQTTEMYLPCILEARNLRSRCQLGWSHSEASLLGL